VPPSSTRISSELSTSLPMAVSSLPPLTTDQFVSGTRTTAREEDRGTAPPTSCRSHSVQTDDTSQLEVAMGYYTYGTSALAVWWPNARLEGVVWWF
jgi:hypothetical protein